MYELSTCVCLVLSTGWQGAVGVAAIDCSEAKNQPICTHYGVQGFPTLRVTDFTHISHVLRQMRTIFNGNITGYFFLHVLCAEKFNLTPGL